MLNQIVLVGRIVENIELEKNNDGSDRANITLAVPRSYKNADGVYETDFVPCELHHGIASAMVDFYKKGDLVGIKGSIKSDDKGIKILAEKVTFLSSKAKENDDIER